MIDHYRNPQQSVTAFFDNGGLCQLPAFSALANCATRYPNNRANSLLAVQKMQQQQTAGVSLFKTPTLTDTQANQLRLFLEALTDPCLLDRACIGKWIPSPTGAPDDLQLNAVDQNGVAL